MTTPTIPEPEEDVNAEEIVVNLYTVKEQVNVSELTESLEIDGKTIPFIVDTGATVSVMGEEEYLSSLSHLPLRKSSVVLKGYSGQVLKVMGEIMVHFMYDDKEYTLPFNNSDSTRKEGNSTRKKLDEGYETGLEKHSKYVISQGIQSTSRYC